MSTLYNVGYMSTATEPFRFDDTVFADLGERLIYQPLRDMPGVPRPPTERIGSAVRAWATAALAMASTEVIAAIIQGISAGTPGAMPPVDEVLAAMAQPGANIWETCVLGTAYDDLWAGRDLLELQDLLHAALPGRFAPLVLSKVSLDVDAVHPDVGRFRVDAAMGARLLMDAGAAHPLRRYFPEPAEAYDGFGRMIMRVDARMERISDEELESMGMEDEVVGDNVFYRAECDLWLPPHLVGALEEHPIWDSTAFAGS